MHLLLHPRLIRSVYFRQKFTFLKYPIVLYVNLWYGL
ncbi:hypothetical protein SLEP1_g5309 [Rubroshorea leprosula]|uniref:Uncharacterized protein n=1 Tax=Rubroshorea leprosula TaxID=152421 RepID=A0AAV5HRJ5_9ROSI|nr:hypothetical protein SLEP1_g5309 [Rubroshorea leprosula]